MTTVSVFGGTGFLGRRLVRRLASEGATLRIAVRSHDRVRSVLPAADLDRVTAVRADVRDPASVAAAVAGADAVVNVVSAYVEKRGVSFESVHVQGARTLAEQAAAAGVARLVLVSGIGADPQSKSPYIRARGRGELAVREACANRFEVRSGRYELTAVHPRFGNVAQSMKLTEQQRQVVLDRNDRVVSSCPGSGKTRIIIAKILDCIEELRGSARKIGCITYTNAAANEIVTRLLETGATGDEDYYEVNTIHSFCLNNIVRPYSYLVDEIKDGFSIVAPDTEWYEQTVGELAGKYSVPTWAKEQFANISKTATGETILPKDIPAAAAAEFLERLRAENLVTFSGIVYFAFLIVTNHKFVARAVSSRFAWLLVDEFQDTSELQTAMLCIIHEVGHTKLFLVGDENQSIYAFAGARPELMGEIAGKIKAETDRRDGGERPVIALDRAFSQKGC